MPSFDRVVQLKVPCASGQTGLGSGTLIGNRLVLTAAHVLQSAEGGAVVARLEVLFPALGGQVLGRPVWSGLAVGLDAALVELDTPPSGLSANRPVRWGRLTGQQPGVTASAIGFPRSLRECDGQRVPEQQSGRVNPGVGFGSRYDLLLDPPHPVAAAGDASPWSGLSGAGLVTGEPDLLIGVVALDLPKFHAGRLSSVPVWRLLQDPGFRARLAEHDVATSWESVELAELFEPEHGRADSPAALLRADNAVVRFRGRESTLDRLQQWCTADEGLSVALVTGPGGQGKTRLARQLSGGLRAAGWVAGFSSTLPPNHPVPVLANSRVPVLVVVDYAEARSEQLHRLVVAAGDPDRPVRLLLLARSPGEWWSDLRARWRFTIGQPLELALPALEDALTGRQQAYREAVQDLAGALPRLTAQAGINWVTKAGRPPATPDLAAPAFESVLTIQLLALTGLLAGDGTGDGGTEPAALEDVLLEHEQLYWQELASRRPGLPALQPATLWRAVATATLCGASTEDQAVATLTRVGGLRDRTEDEYLGLARWLAELYPSAEGRYWGPLQPDRVGEHLIGRVTHERPKLINEVLAGANQEQAHRALTVLTRAAATQPHLPPQLSDVISKQLAQLGPVALQVALEAAAPGPLLHAVRSAALKSEQPRQLQTLLAALPERSVLLAQTTLEVQKHAVDLTRRDAAADRDAHLPDLAMSVNNLALLLSQAGRRADGLAAAQEAVEYCRELVGLNRDAYLSRLAGLVSNLANHLSGNGRHDEALAAAEEAVEYCRELVGLNCDAYLPELALSVHNHANHLNWTGRRADGLTAAEEAVKYYRELVGLNRDAYLPGLAMSVHTLAINLTGNGRRDEGLAAAQDAVDLRRELVELNRDAHLPDLAKSVTNFAVWLAENGRVADGLTAADEAVKYYRELVELHRDAYLPELALSIHNLANCLTGAGRRADGLIAAEEAVKYYRELVELHRDAYLPELALSIHNLANCLTGAGRGADGLIAAEEAVKYYRELAGLHRDVYLSRLAGSVSTLANCLTGAGRGADGLATAEEAGTYYRELVRLYRDAYLPDLAASVQNLANHLAENGRHDDGLTAAEEAVKYYRELVGLYRDAHLPNLATSVHTLAHHLTGNGRRDDGLTAAQEAVALRRELVELNRDAHLPDLAASVQNLAIDLADNERRAEGVAAAKEAVKYYRELARAGPELYCSAADQAAELAALLSEGAVP